MSILIKKTKITFALFALVINSNKRAAKVKDHLEAIHFPGHFIYSCEICVKTFSGKNAFAVHNSIKHPKK